MRRGYRKELTREGSQDLFTATAMKIHRKNIDPRPMRGGIRL